MKTFTAIIAASALLSYVSGSPIQARGNTCGSAPAGSGSVTPLSQPTSVNTAQGCQGQCDNDASCLSFGFGTKDNDVTTCVCILFPVPASEVPPQSNVNVNVFDKACTAVPAIVPTTSNPTGAGTASSGGSPATSSPSSGGNNPVSNTNTNPGNGSPKLALRDTCGAQPSGPTGNTVSPISTPPNISSPAACLLACQGFSGCKSCEFGPQAQGGASVCYLFSVPVSSLPPPAGGASYVAYDSGCPAPA